MQRGWIVASICFLALFAFAIYLSMKLPLIDALGPGPGFFPIWLGGLGALLSVWLIVETVRVPIEGGEESLIPDRPAMFRILAVIVLLALAAALLDTLGWRLTALLVTGLLLPALGARSPLVIVPFVLGASFGVFHVFYHWLKVPLPIGMLGI